MAYGICELVWPKILLKELGKEVKLSESLYCENNVTISIVHSLIIQCMMLELSIFRNTNTSLMNKSGVAKSVPFFLFSIFFLFMPFFLSPLRLELGTSYKLTPTLYHLSQALRANLYSIYGN